MSYYAGHPAAVREQLADARRLAAHFMALAHDRGELLWRAIDDPKSPAEEEAVGELILDHLLRTTPHLQPRRKAPA